MINQKNKKKLALKLIFAMAWFFAFATICTGMINNNLCSTVGGGFLLVCWTLCFMFCSDDLLKL